jgi:TrmH family RNA methyltransferase
MLTSLQNSLVKQIRKLQRSKHRQEQQRFLLEGTHLLAEACRWAWPLEVVCFTLEWQQNHEELLQGLQESAVRIEVVSPEVLRAIATTVQPDGVVAVARARAQQPLNFTSLGLILETIQDPGNLGTIIRTAAAAGAEGLLLSADSVDLENPKVLRASAGQWFHLPMAVSHSLETEIERYKHQGMQIVATLPQATLNYWQVDLRSPTLILIGNEGAGLSNKLVKLADYQVKIPLDQGVESLNVAIAAALLLYEVQRQYIFAPSINPPP